MPNAKKKATAKLEVVKTGYFEGYTKCPKAGCRRSMKDIEGHLADHRSGKIGDDGRRTDRKPAEKLAWKNRFNGSEATAKFAKTKVKAKKAKAKKAKAA